MITIKKPMKPDNSQKSNRGTIGLDNWDLKIENVSGNWGSPKYEIKEYKQTNVGARMKGCS